MLACTANDDAVSDGVLCIVIYGTPVDMLGVDASTFAVAATMARETFAAERRFAMRYGTHHPMCAYLLLLDL
jgi:hypothetical protein